MSLDPRLMRARRRVQDTLERFVSALFVTRVFRSGMAIHPTSILEFPLNTPIACLGRLEKPMRQICISIDAMVFAIHLFKNGEPPEVGSAPIILRGSFPIFLATPTGVHLKAAIEESTLPPVEVALIEAAGNAPSVPPSGNMSNFASVTTNAVSQCFVTFYEAYCPLIREASGHNRDKWHQTWQFSRIIRNAITHDKLNIKDPKHPIISWHHFSYGPESDGKDIIGREIFAPDIIFLMIEMEIALCEIEAL